MNKTELTIQEIHTVTLNVLQTFHDLCEREGFRYYLAYGTLLGLFAIMDLFRGMMMQTFGCQEKTMTDFWIIAKRTRTR